MTLLESSLGPLRLGLAQVQPGAGGGGVPEGSAWVRSVYAEDLNGTGEHDITSADIPGTPKAAMVFLVGSDSMSIGVVTASDEKFFFAQHADSGTAQITSASELNTDQLGRVEDNAALETEFDFVGFLDDGMTIDITTNGGFGGDEHFLVLFFGGSSCSAKTITHNVDGNAVDNTVDVTTVGFEPELVFTLAGNSGQTSLGRVVNSTMSMGVTHNDGTADPVPQYGLAWELEDDTMLCSLRMQHRNTSGRAIVGETNGGDELVACDLNSFDASGYTVQCRERTAWGTTLCGALCITWAGDADIHLTAFDSPTVDGDVSYTGPGFKPDWLWMLCTRTATADETAGVDDDEAHGWNLGWTDGVNDPDPDEIQTDTRFFATMYSDDGNATTTSAQQAGSVPTMFPSTTRIIASISGGLSAAQRLTLDADSFDTNGYTLEYLESASSAKSLIALVLRDNT